MCHFKFIFLLSFLTSNIVYSAPSKNLPVSENGPWVVNVYYENVDQLRAIARDSDIWKVYRKENYFVTSVDNLQEYQKLIDFGFSLEINQKQMKYQKENKLRMAKELNLAGSDTIPGFPCERTVEGTFNTIDNLVLTYPDLASNIILGESWEKQNPGGQSNGYDLRVIKITNSDIKGPKPILYVTSSMHARELAPAELNTRFAEYLLENYGTNADITWIVDHREIHLLLQANPDGRKRAEGPDTNKRKNQNNNHCPGGNLRGVDMNRNFPWMWGEGSGSSGNACNISQIYRGPSPASEFENQAIDTHLKNLFDDDRGPNLSDPAPLDKSGIYIDLHSEAALILWPYGFDDPGAIQEAPNHDELQTLGRKLAWFNGYFPQKANDLYGADGAAEDNAYGQLGVAAYTFELDGDAQFFRPTCDYVDNTIVPDNLRALIYAAKVADKPYITASGPDIEDLVLSGSDIIAGTEITVSGNATDLQYSNANNTAQHPAENTHNITEVQLYIDQLPWDNSSVPIMLNAVDGNFDSENEEFSGQIDTSNLSAGQHTIFIVATDSNGITGVPYAHYFNIIDPAIIGTISGTITDASSLEPIETATVILGKLQTVTNEQGLYNFEGLAGEYTLSASKESYESISYKNITITGSQSTTQDIQLQPICSIIDENVNNFMSISDAEAMGWTHGQNIGNDDWNINLTQGMNSSHAFNTSDVGTTTDKFLISPQITLYSASILEFWHKYVFEGNATYYDGAVLEISSDLGQNWQDLGSQMTVGGYNGLLSAGNALGVREGWGGSNPSYTKVSVDLSSFAGQNVQFRWRFGADSGVGAGDWNIDDIKVIDPSVCDDNDIIFRSSFDIIN